MTPQRPRRAAFGSRRTAQLARRRRARSTGWPRGSARTPFFAYDRAADHRAGGAAARGAAGAASQLSYAVKANPMPAVVQHLAGLVDSLDVASAGEMRIALDTGDRRRPRSASPARARPTAELRQAVAAGVTDRARVGRRGRRRGRAAGEDARACGRGSRSGSTPTSRSRAPACGWAAGRSSSASTPSRCRRCCDLAAELDLDLLGFHVFAGSQNLRADILAEAQRRTVDLLLRPGRRRCPTPVRYLNLGGGFGIPYFEQDAAARPGAGRRRTCADAGRRRRSPPALPEARVVDRARPLPGRRGGRLRHPGRRPQGLARPDLPRRRRRHAPPAGGVRQLRPGDPAQLPARGRQPARRRRRPRPVTVVGCLCTPLDLLGDDVDAARGRGRRPRRALPGRRLRPDRQPHRVPRPPGPRRSSRR